MQHRRNLLIPDTLAEVCDPDRIALIVYDMQVGVVRQLADGPQVTERVGQVLEAARRAAVRVFFTRHMTLPTELMGVSQLRAAMAWQRKDRVEDVVSPFLRDSPGFQIVPELRPRASEAVFDKLSMSPFEGTPLEFALRDAQVTAFAIAGVATEVGIEPTVRHGADRGLIPVLVTDACGAGNRAAARRSLDCARHCRRRDPDRHRNDDRPPCKRCAKRPAIDKTTIPSGGLPMTTIGRRSTHHEIVDVTSPSRRPSVLMVVANPTTSSTTGWPVGFWAAELFHPLYEFTKARYQVTVASPDGGRVELDAMSDPRDESRWSADDLISMGALNTPEIAALLERTPRLTDLDLDEFDALMVCGGQAPMFQFPDNEGPAAGDRALL